MSRVGPGLDGQWLSQRYREVRARTLRLVDSLSPEDQQIQGFEYASPTKWHLAHTTWFFETFFLKQASGPWTPFDASFAVLFNSYYEGVGHRHSRAQRGLLSRPSLELVYRYRAAIDNQILELLATGNDSEQWPTIALGLQHEEQHQELLLTDILANLSLNPTHPAWRDEVLWSDPNSNATTSKVTTPEWVELDPGLHEVGHAGKDFCFDNERPRHRTYLSPCVLRSTLVSNAEVMAFIADDGYTQAGLWLSDGIDWVRQNNINAPEYWHKNKDDQWCSFTLYGDRPIDLMAPATHLSGYEADAIATWLGARLPTEQEWESAALQFGGHPDQGRWLENGPVMPCHQVIKPGRLTGLWGETWEWTRSAYQPYPGFRPLPGAVGEYNGKFMANQWVLRGGSCASPTGHVRPSYRNFFYPHQRWQFTGLRPARDLV